MDNNKNIKDARLVFDADICRRLLRVGCTIIDVKPNKENPVKTVFVFKNDDDFQNKLESIHDVQKEDNRKITDAKLIFNAGTCRSLLRAGCTIIDVKPDRDNPVKTVFVFDKNEHFQKEFERINKEIAQVKEQGAN